MKILKSIVLEPEESQEFLKKYLKKFMEGKFGGKVVSIEVNENFSVNVSFQEEQVEEENG